VYICREFSYKSPGERILKIGPYLPRLLSNIKECTFFGLSVPIQCQFFSWWWANWNRYPWFFIIVKTVFCNISYTQLSLLLLLLLLYMVVIVTVTVTVFVIIIKRSSICHGTCQSWNDEYSINILLVYVVYKQQIFFRKLINYSTNRFLNWIFFSQI